MMGDYFHLLPDGGHNKISGFTFSFHPSCFRWSQKSDVPAWQMLSVMDEASESLCVRRKCFVGGISTLSSDGAYFCVYLVLRRTLNTMYLDRTQQTIAWFYFRGIPLTFKCYMKEIKQILAPGHRGNYFEVHFKTFSCIYSLLCHLKRRKKNLQQDCHMQIMLITQNANYVFPCLLTRLINWLKAHQKLQIRGLLVIQKDIRRCTEWHFRRWAWKWAPTNMLTCQLSLKQNKLAKRSCTFWHLADLQSFCSFTRVCVIKISGETTHKYTPL